MTAQPEYCLWLGEHDYLVEMCIWETSCGNSFIFNEDGPEENNFEFCPYCGLPIKTGVE